MVVLVLKRCKTTAADTRAQPAKVSEPLITDKAEFSKIERLVKSPEEPGLVTTVVVQTFDL